MKFLLKKFVLLGGILGMLIFPFYPAKADVELSDLPADDFFFKAKVIEADNDLDNPLSFYRAEALEGPLRGQQVEVYQESIKNLKIYKEIVPGDTIVVLRTTLSTYEFELYDKYRTPKFGIVILLFFLLVFFIAKMKGIKALFSLVFSLGVIVSIIVPLLAYSKVPQILSILTGAVIILIISIYLSHGVKRKTHIAFVSSLISLLVGTILGYLSINLIGLLGIGADEAIYLQLGNMDHINLKTLLLGSMILGAVGVLDDVTILQASVVEELKETNDKLEYKELFKKSMKIGNEHIISMVNTLFIAYIGAALPIILFYGSDSSIATPLWVIFNSEAVIEELLRSIIASSALIISVPICTAMATSIISKNYDKN